MRAFSHLIHLLYKELDRLIGVLLKEIGEDHKDAINVYGELKLLCVFLYLSFLLQSIFPVLA